MILDEIAAFLVAQGHGTLSTDLFKGRIPEAPDSLVCLRETGGLPPILTHEVAGITIERSGLQILCRGLQGDYLTPRTKAKQVFEDLVEVRNQLLSGVRYLSIEALQQPFSLGRDENDRELIGFNVVCTKEPS